MINKKLGLSSVTVIIIVAVIIVITSLTIIVVNKNKQKKEESNNSINYEETASGTKINTSKEVSNDQKIEDVLIEESNIVYKNGISTLTSKVTNNGEAKDNLKFNIKVIANDGTVMTELVGLVGKIEQNQIKYITSSITMDITNAKSIEYKIIK